MEDAQDLGKLRHEIDDIDEQIMRLFERRMEVSSAVADYKAIHHMPVLDRRREREVVREAGNSVPEEMRTYAEVLMTLLMEASRARQDARLGNTSPISSHIEEIYAKSPDHFPREATVACQGVEGAYSQMACDRLFRHATIRYGATFDDVFNDVENRSCDFGVLPVENSTAGTVNRVYDLMMQHHFSIVRTCRIKVDHNLLAKPGTGLEQITDIYSHEQAIRQCGAFLSKLKGVQVHAVENTAMAAKLVAESPSSGVAALASRSAGDLYGLEAVARAVQDKDNNYTRFACISRDQLIFPGADRTSLMLVLPHEPGALYKILARFYSLDINIIKLESRPIPDRDFEFMFYFDVECPVTAPEFKRLMMTLPDACEEFRYLGSYSEVL